MSKVRLREGYGPRYVTPLDRQVEDGETVEVPDFQADGESPLVWPEETWEPVAEPKVAPEKAAKKDTTDKAAG